MTETNVRLEDWLDDLCVRFIINLPRDDLESVPRICFQVEEAQWFYEDFIRPLDPTLPSMTLRTFCLRMFQHCPLLASFSAENHTRAFQEFLHYKTRVPVRGAILLNEAMDSTVLVKGWKKGANWSFPRGKINKDEDDLDCAIREVYEETGYHIKEAGLVPEHDNVKYIEINMREQQIRLYVFRNVPMSTVFQPKTRKEISKIQWYKLSDLPAFRRKGNGQQDDVAAASNANRFYMVAPFLVPLKKWVVQQKKKDAAAATVATSHLSLPSQVLHEETPTEDETGAETGAPQEQAVFAKSLASGDLKQTQNDRKCHVRAQPPPTQTTQMMPSASDQGKGNALMALLKAKVSRPADAQQPLTNSPQDGVPHTPYGMIQMSIPQPDTPHYHHPIRRLSANDDQDPPPFPYLARSVPTVGPASTHGSGVALHEALPFQATQHNAHGAIGSHKTVRSPNLTEPQPFQPQFQQLRPARDLQVPNLPDAMNQTALQTGQVQQNGRLNHDQHPSMQAPRPQSRVQDWSQSQHGHDDRPSPPLPNRHLALMYAFKGEPTPPNARGPRGASEGCSASGDRGAELPRFGIQDLDLRSQASVAPSVSHFAPSSELQGSRPSLSPFEPLSTKQAARSGSVHKSQLPIDKHRASLLDIFKNPIPASPIHGDSATKANKLPLSMGFTTISQGSENLVPTQISTPQAPHTAAQTSGSPMPGNPQLSALPSHHPDMLSCGRVDMSGTSNPAYQQQQRSSSSLGQRVGAYSPFTRGIPHHPRQHTLALPYEAQQLPIHNRPAPTNGPASPNMFHGRREFNSDQKQKLLSLFGKAQRSPTGISAAVSPVVLASSAQTHRAQVRPDEVAPGTVLLKKHGSQTPISPADRSFLLELLHNQPAPGEAR